MTHSIYAEAPAIEAVLNGVPDLTETDAAINALTQWPENWNGCGAAKPDLEAIAHAVLWIRQMGQDAIEATGSWMEPHVTADAEGNVVFEWWNDPKKLTIYVSPRTVEFVKVWGSNIINDMADGEVRAPEEQRALWTWFMNQDR